MTITWNHELLEQLDWYMVHHFRPRMRGLTDEEYFWEPVAGCWNVRRTDDGRFEMDHARNMDDAPTPAPFTTIAWRLAHIGSGVLGMRARNHFGDGAFTFDDVDWPGSAAEGLEFVADAYDAWKEGVAALGDEGLARPCGPAEGPYAEHPFAALVLHINREMLHHGAEVCCIRDLYAHRTSLGVPAGSSPA